MYSTGTVTTTANSTKLVGTGTKWLNNINRVSAEQAIQIQIGTTVHNNSIQSIQSDTELTLNFPLPAAATGAKYVILTTMVHSASDAMNKIVSMNGANVQFSDILMRWMTEQGIITVTLPDQTTQQLRTTKEMDRLLDGKLDKAGGTVGRLTVTQSGDAIHIKPSTNGGNSYYQIDEFDGKRAAFIGFGGNSEDKTFTIRNDKDGTNLRINSGNAYVNGVRALVTGDYGLGSTAVSIADGTDLLEFFKTAPTGFYRTGGNVTNKPHPSVGYADYLCIKHAAQLKVICYSNTNLTYEAYFDGAKWIGWSPNYSASNTTKDSNGNLKAASPVIKVFADHIELNDESEGVELEKLGIGLYKLKGTLGMHSDASWGGIHGGLVVPNGINNLPLVWADFDVLPDGDIVIETRYRKHTLHQMLEAQRLMTYPEFLDENNIEREDYDYCDIPNGHWIDVRVNMPSDSIYNQKQAEAERLAKLEAERLAREEAKRAAEEAERPV